MTAVYLHVEKKDSHIQGIIETVSSRGVPITYTDRTFFDSRFHKGHQGIAAMVSPRRYIDIESLLKIPERTHGIPLFLILDCIEDPRNFGAILRVADAGGVHGVVIQSHRSASLGPEAFKASAGAAEHIPISVVTNVKHAIRNMRENGVMIVGAEAGAGKALWDLNFGVPIAVVIGSEGKGMRRTVRDDCDHIVSLPMKGMVNSLNASVACGIIIFEIMRQRMMMSEIK